MRRFVPLMLALPLFASAQITTPATPTATSATATNRLFSSSVTALSLDTGSSGPENTAIGEDSATTPSAQPQHYSKAERDAARIARHPIFDDQYHWGLLALAGSAGLGVQLAYPISHHIILRGGGDFFRYAESGKRDQAVYNGSLQFGDARFAVDYFPWRERRFHISPLLIFANQTHATASFNIPPGDSFGLEGGDYYSSSTDPLRGNGRVDFRKTSPGIALGFGNLSHGHGHWVFPVEFGFYYNSTPTFQINFTGTACDPNQPPSIGCQSVENNAEFQSDLQDLRREIHDDLRYARFVPILNYGVGYRF